MPLNYQEAKEAMLKEGFGAFPVKVGERPPFISAALWNHNIDYSNRLWQWNNCPDQYDLESQYNIQHITILNAASC